MVVLSVALYHQSHTPMNYYNPQSIPTYDHYKYNNYDDHNRDIEEGNQSPNKLPLNPKSSLNLTRLILLLIPVILLILAYIELRRPDQEFNEVAGLKEVKPVDDNGFDFEEGVVIEEFDKRVFDLDDKNLPDFHIKKREGDPINPGIVNSSIFPLFSLRTGYHHQIPDLIVSKQVALHDTDPQTGWTLLHYLARSHSLVALRWILSKNVYGDEGVNLRSKEGVKLEDLEFRNSEPFENSTGHIFGGDTPLHLAVTHPNRILALFFTKVLLQFGASPDLPNAANQTARLLAAGRFCFKELVEVIEGTFDPGLIYESNDKTYLDFAFGSHGPPADPYFWY